MKKVDRRKLKEKGIKSQCVSKAVRKYKEGSFTYSINEDGLGRRIESEDDKK